MIINVFFAGDVHSKPNHEPITDKIKQKCSTRGTQKEYKTNIFETQYLAYVPTHWYQIFGKLYNE